MKALWRDDPTEATMTVDIRLDAETGSILAPWDLFGAFDLDGDRSRPFILRRDGEIDFGASAARRWRTNLRDLRVGVGARFQVYWNESDAGDYEVVKIARLGSRERRG
ncbi:hypothetical protein DSM21852_38900 [Methylocystis bryophila]|nr:hypothetical protein DSM21852_38900 [Methylocystis bryophila]